MRRVWTFSRWGAGLALGLAAIAFLLVSSDAKVAQATTFNMTFDASVADTTANASSDLTLTFTIPSGDSNADLDSIFLFIPPEWDIATTGEEGAPPVGAIVGGIDTLVTLGILGSPCAGVLDPTFTMFEATTDTTDTISFVGGFGVGDDFLLRGVTKYSEYLNDLFPDDAPIERMFGVKQITATTFTQINVLIFAPGSLGFDESLGYPLVGVLNDPTLEIPQDVSDFCTPLFVSITILGTSVDNENTEAEEGDFVKLQNPSSEVSIFRLITESDPDADTDVENAAVLAAGGPGGSLENDIDTCPFDPNVDAPLRGPIAAFGIPEGALFDAFFPGPPFGFGDPDGDTIDSACDENPDSFDGIDVDFDKFLNRQDNCPQTKNIDDVIENPLGPGFVNAQFDDDNDGIGNACDDNPNTPDGHTHQTTLTVPIVIGDHGVELKDLTGAEDVADGGKASYAVTVKNEDPNASITQDIEVALRVLGGCGTVNGDPDGQDEDTAARVRSGQTKTVRFTVNWSGCTPGSYIVEADACHADDPGVGFFGEGDCPGAADGHNTVDANTDDDAPQAINVEVGG